MRLCWTSCVMTQLFVLGTEQYRSSKSVLPELVEGGGLGFDKLSPNGFRMR